MNSLLKRNSYARLSRGYRSANAAARAVFTPGGCPTVYEEMLAGSLVGLFACLLFSWVAGGTVAAVLAAATGGFCAGAVIGLVLWSSTADLPEDPVLPVHPSQRRERNRPPG